MKKLLHLIIFSLILEVFAVPAYALELPVFFGDVNYPIKQNVLVLDSNDSGGDVSLQFGETLGENIYWDANGGDTTGIFDFSDDVLIEGKLGVGLSAGDNPASSLHLYENTTSVDATAGTTIENAGTGDAIMQFLLTGVTRWVMGIDNSDSDKFKIAYSADLNSDAAITINTSGQVGIGGTNPDASLDIEENGEVVELGDGTANDVTINFDDGTERSLGWDDSETAFSTFNQQIAFRTRQGSSPPVSCSSTVAGMQWMDTDTGILYICDTSNSRNKWFSTQDLVIFGEDTGSCDSGANIGNDRDCTANWGSTLGSDGSTDLGFYIPYPITITGYGFSEDNDACTSGSFALEVWSTGSNSNDNDYTFEADISTGLTGEAHNSNSLNVNIAGDQYILWGIDNDCGQSIDDWNMVLYYRWRHN